MIHQPSGGARGQASDIQIQAEQILKSKKLLNQILAERTGQPLSKVEIDVERDHFLTSQEALEYGIIDEIVSPRR
jgi:ATP-dependent Clp protease protease subunit